MLSNVYLICKASVVKRLYNVSRRGLLKQKGYIAVPFGLVEAFVLCRCAYLFGGSFCTILLYLLVEWKYLYYIALLFCLV